jgi:hypothetical protein
MTSPAKNETCDGVRLRHWRPSNVRTVGLQHERFEDTLPEEE